MPRGQRRAQRAAGIARGRLNPNLLKNFFAQNEAVRHAIERHAARQAEIFRAGHFARMARQQQHDFFRHHLNRARHVHVPLLDFFLRPARRPAEKRVKLLIGHRRAAQEIEVIQIQPERTVGL